MKIDLARKSYDTPVPMKAESSKPSYPCLHIDCGDVMLAGLPDSGIMEVKFKVVSRSCSERDGKKECCICIEVQKILDVTKGPKDIDDTSEALDKLAELESATEDSEE